MKKLNSCDSENCIPTPTSCNYWNGGEVESLGICNGDPLNNLLWEIITKLEEITGDDLSEFDIDSLLEICNQQAPTEVTIISILNLLKQNQVCLKDFIDNLSEQLSELFADTGITVNLKCYADFDNLGNPLSITRETLDQLIIDNLCSQKLRIDTLEGKVISLQSQVDNINSSTTVDELSFATCINASQLPTSTQVINTAEAFCDLEDATGDSADISAALANTPADMNAEFGLLPGWILNPANWAENYNNLLIAFGNIWARLEANEACCEATCEDVKLGFSAVYNEDADGVIISFTFGAGTDIPTGFEDGGSHGTITDVDGNSVDFNITIENNSTEEVIIAGLNTTSPLDISITAIMTNGALTCQKCVSRRVAQASCAFCEICAEGNDDDASVVIIYESSKSSVVIENSTTSSTTTTTTSEA